MSKFSISSRGKYQNSENSAIEVKKKNSDISEFSILDIGQNRKLGNIRNWRIFLLNAIVKYSFLFLRLYFSF